jgi:hypothetical protein
MNNNFYPVKLERFEIAVPVSRPKVQPVPQDQPETTHIIEYMPGNGQVLFFCSANPGLKFNAPEQLARCPICRKINPLKEGWQP